MTKKPRIGTLRQYLDDSQEKMRVSGIFFKKGDPLAGRCGQNADIANDFGGITYDTRERSHHGPWGHTVAVISPKGISGGLVVDITQIPAIIGIIHNLQEEDKVRETLRELLGVGGWARRK